MNDFQICSSSSELLPLYLPLNLYLKPITRVCISLALSSKIGKSISYWEIMDKIRDLVKPEEFKMLKVTKTTIEHIMFEGELETKRKLGRIISKLDNKMIKLKDFNNFMKIRAEILKSDFPTQKVWDEFFHHARDMNEMKPGERPDTIHIANLPVEWFMSHQTSKEKVPSEKVIQKIFQNFGTIRNVDIPICDPYRKKMNDQISGIKSNSFENTDNFEAYVQFKDYIGFKNAMDTFFEKKLVHKVDSTAKEVDLKIDFDRTKHMSEASINRRKIVRERLILREKNRRNQEITALREMKQKRDLEKRKQLDLKVQKHLRRKLREEKRKAKIFQKLEIIGTDDINCKIEKEEKKLLKVQRKLEAIRLVEELFNRIKEKNPDYAIHYQINNDSAQECKKMKTKSETEVQAQAERLKHTMERREMLKVVLSKDDAKSHIQSNSSSDTELSLSDPVETEVPPPVVEKYPELLCDPHLLGYPYHMSSRFLGPAYRSFNNNFRGTNSRRRPFRRYPNGPGPSTGRRSNFKYQRGYNRTYRENLLPVQDLEKACRKYFNKLLYEENRNSTSTHSRSRFRSYSRSDTHSRSKERSGSSSSSRERHTPSNRRDRYKRNYSRSRSRSNTRKSKSRSKSKSRQRSISVDNDNSSSRDCSLNRRKMSDETKTTKRSSGTHTPELSQNKSESSHHSK